MTISARNNAVGGVTTAGATFTTGSVSLKADKLYLLSIRGHCASGSAATPTVTGAGQTWVLLANRADTGDSTRRVTVWRCMPTADAAGALTVAFAGQQQSNGFGWILDEFTGVELGGNGANAIVSQAATDSAGATVTSIKVTLPAFARPTNMAYATLTCPGSAAAATPEAGYTELATTSPGYGMGSTQAKASADTTPTFTLDSRVVSGMIGFELDEAQAVAAARQTAQVIVA